MGGRRWDRGLFWLGGFGQVWRLRTTSGARGRFVAALAKQYRDSPALVTMKLLDAAGVLTFDVPDV